MLPILVALLNTMGHTQTASKIDGLIIAGLDYIPVSNMHLMPNVMIKSYVKDGVKDDITGRITLDVKFDSGKITGE